jgi:hypothetical protein
LAIAWLSNAPGPACPKFCENCDCCPLSPRLVAGSLPVVSNPSKSEQC